MIKANKRNNNLVKSLNYYSNQPFGIDAVSNLIYLSGSHLD